jgi:hypothetical protein
MPTSAPTNVSQNGAIFKVEGLTPETTHVLFKIKKGGNAILIAKVKRIDMTSEVMENIDITQSSPSRSVKDIASELNAQGETLDAEVLQLDSGGNQSPPWTGQVTLDATAVSVIITRNPPAPAPQTPPSSGSAGTAPAGGPAGGGNAGSQGQARRQNRGGGNAGGSQPGNPGGGSHSSSNQPGNNNIAQLVAAVNSGNAQMVQSMGQLNAAVTNLLNRTTAAPAASTTMPSSAAPASTAPAASSSSPSTGNGGNGNKATAPIPVNIKVETQEKDRTMAYVVISICVLLLILAFFFGWMVYKTPAVFKTTADLSTSHRDTGQPSNTRSVTPRMPRTFHYEDVPAATPMVTSTDSPKPQKDEGAIDMTGDKIVRPQMASLKTSCTPTIASSDAVVHTVVIDHVQTWGSGGDYAVNYRLGSSRCNNWTSAPAPACRPPINVTAVHTQRGSGYVLTSSPAFGVSRDLVENGTGFRVVASSHGSYKGGRH